MAKSLGRSPSAGSGSHQVISRATIAIPPGLLVGWIVYALVIRRYLAHDAFAAVWGALVLASLAGLCVGVWRVMLSRSGDEAGSRRRIPVATWLAMAAAVGGSTWAFVVGFVLPTLSFRPFVFLLIPGASWVSVQLLYSVQRAHAQAAGYQNPLEKVKATTAIASINSIRPRGDAVEANGVLQPGEQVKELQARTGELESALDARPGSVQIMPDLDHARRFKLIVRLVDTLKGSPHWPGPSIPYGASLADPIVTGLCEDKTHDRFWLVGDPTQGRNAAQIQLTGMPGSGKSVWYQLVALEVLSRGREARYYYCDGRKADQQPAWLLAGADGVYDTNEKVARFLLWVRDVEVPRRQAELGKRGFAQWQPGCGTDHWTIFVDEIASVAQDIARLLADLGETLRSLGIVLVAGLQRASGDRWPTSARSQFGTNITFGVKNDDDSRMALSDAQLESGACRPELWGTKKPGMHYVDAPGLDDEEILMPRRTYRPDKVMMQRWAEYYINQRAAEQPAAGDGAALVVPAKAVQQPVRAARAVRVSPVQSAPARPADVATRGVEGVVVDDDSDDRVRDVATPATLDDLEADVAAALSAQYTRDPDDDDDPFGENEAGDAIADMIDDASEGVDLDGSYRGVDVDEETRAAMATAGDAWIPEPGTGEQDITIPVSKTPGAAQQFLASYIHAMRMNGVTEFLPKDLAPVLEATGYSPGWQAKWLKRWADEGLYGLSTMGPKRGWRLEPLPDGQRELEHA